MAKPALDMTDEELMELMQQRRAEKAKAAAAASASASASASAAQQETLPWPGVSHISAPAVPCVTVVPVAKKLAPPPLPAPTTPMLPAPTTPTLETLQAATKHAAAQQTVAQPPPPPPPAGGWSGRGSAWASTWSSGASAGTGSSGSMKADLAASMKADLATTKAKSGMPAAPPNRVAAGSVASDVQSVSSLASDTQSASGPARSTSTSSKSDLPATGTVRRWSKVHEAKLGSESSTAELVELTAALRVNAPVEVKWPWTRCDTPACETTEKWFRMHCEKVWTNEEDFAWKRTCKACIGALHGLSDAEAAAWIITATGSIGERKMERVVKFKEAIANIQETFPAMKACSKHQLVSFTMASMKELWGTLSKHTIRRREVQERAVQDMGKWQELSEELKTAPTLEAQERILTQMEALQTWEPDLAFADRGPVEQERMLRACSYSDCWVELKDKQGNLRGRIDSYYPCLAKVGYADCLSIVPSIDWETDTPNKIDARKWTCPSKDCWSKFKYSWGQLVVITRATAAGGLEMLYMRAEVPPWSLEDIRAMHLEETVAGPQETPESLLSKIARVLPSTNDLVLDKPGNPGMRVFCNRKILESLPFFKWEQIFNMVGVQGPAPKPKSKKSRR